MREATHAEMDSAAMEAMGSRCLWAPLKPVETFPSSSSNSVQPCSKVSVKVLAQAHTSESQQVEICLSLPRMDSPPQAHRRLQDWIEELETLNKEGTLKMRQVRHKKFYDTCKKHKAVNEAFRFTRLIKKPSLVHFNQLLSVCASANNLDGAFEVFELVKREGLKADCVLYTTLISACAKAGKVESMFQVFHEMTSNGVEPNVHTYGALIDGCARAGQVGKAFGVYGILRSKKQKPDQVIFNSLITACGQARALERAFDVLSEMTSDPTTVRPNHVTLGTLIKACTRAGRVEKAMDVYAMMEKDKIEGSIEVYTEAVHACSKINDLDTALSIYKDLKNSSIRPDEVFFSALIDVAGHAGKLDSCFMFLNEMKEFKLRAGKVVYSSLMGACSNTGDWKMALQVYRDMQNACLSPTIDTMNALLTALCGSEQLEEAKRVVQDMRQTGYTLNQITYTVLFKACKQLSDIDFAFDLHKCATSKGIIPSVEICESIIGLCLRQVWTLTRGPTPTTSVGTVESVSFCGRCTSWALSVYRRAVTSGVAPTMKMFSQLLGCLRLPKTVDDSALRNYSFAKHSSCDMQPSLIDGFGVYDPRALALFEEAAALGLAPNFSYTGGPIVVDTSVMPVFVAEVCLLTIFKGLKHRVAAGARIPSIKVILGVTRSELSIPDSKQEEVPLLSRTSQAVTGLFRMLKLNFYGHESSGLLRVSASAIKEWLQPKPEWLQVSPLATGPRHSSLAQRIVEQQRMLRYMRPSMWSPPTSPQDSPKHSPSNLSYLPINEECVSIHHPASNGVHVLDSTKPEATLGMPSAMEEILSI
ncbi:hypothetical protein GOP47_0030165 [Adiantum capillus-veneris]|nr:hypothetical protein GOP47_0030165 [Adiantum capillus-veneris]